MANVVTVTVTVTVGGGSEGVRVLKGTVRAQLVVDVMNVVVLMYSLGTSK